MEQLYLKAQAPGKTLIINYQLKIALVKRLLTKLLLFLSCCIASHWVEWPEFHVVCQDLNPKAGTAISKA
jgi:hypothetical protein